MTTLVMVLLGAMAVLFTVAVFYWRGQERGYNTGYAEGFADAAIHHHNVCPYPPSDHVHRHRPQDDIQRGWDDPPAWDDVERG
jgi:hypothetical protein